MPALRQLRAFRLGQLPVKHPQFKLTHYASHAFMLLCCAVRRTALTHFSQRYPRMPAGFPADATPWARRPLLAVDGAVLRFDLLPVLPALMPAVAAALEEVCEEDEGQAGEEEGGDAGVEEEAGAAAAAPAAAPSGGCCG